MISFKPDCLPLLIGSLPSDNHRKSAELIFDFTPHIPIWPQLPVFKEEGMILQYLPGFPGVTELDGKVFIDTEKTGFEEELLAFYEEYIMVSEGGADLDGSRFALSRDAAAGFYEFLQIASENSSGLVALKGQTSGPVTFCTGLTDQAGRAIFYNDQLRDAAVKHLAMKAKWQIRKMAAFCDRTIMFFDEPGLAGVGSSAFITITTDDIISCLSEVFEAVRSENGLTGVHVCANTEWSVIFDSGVDIVSYDAYGYFDKLVLYGDHLKAFFKKGGILATGIIPTSPEFIDSETVESLTDKWRRQTGELVSLGISEETVRHQTLITPSCGTGTVSESQALRVIELTKLVSEKIRAE
ncbi:MAG: hypothetical protein JRJ68_11620 [Deltaproteobacteria bacterium]|nr:hypothetical protein [Deltaproteobacteria bacterium]